MLRRQSGILLHISSLPSDFGIGDLGPNAYQFIDFLVESKQSLWQILPLNPTNPFWGNSPYTSYSAFAGNPLLISPEKLCEYQLLSSDDINNPSQFLEDAVDYEAVVPYKMGLLQKAFQCFKTNSHLLEEFHQFKDNHKQWLDTYALFCLIKEEQQGECWNTWPNPILNFHTNLISQLKTDQREKILEIQFIQFIFYKQWFELKNYANSQNIELIGDIPIYVNFDSADVWSHKQIFKINTQNKMDVVSGVPPDYFSKTGQRWGNPVYNWKAMKENRYDWWCKRIQHNLDLFDHVRIDHFRALVNYWEIPATEKTAINGYWVDVPTDDFVSHLRSSFKELPFIAEDLGLIDDETKAKIDSLGFPGMKILLFAFGGDMKEHIYLPHNYTDNCVVYTGTHDNNTIMGWYDGEATPKEKLNFQEYYKSHSMNVSNDHAIHWDMIELALQSKAHMAIIPMQDLLGLDKSYRMNIPGTIDKNWIYRVMQGQFNTCLSQRLAQYTTQSSR